MGAWEEGVKQMLAGIMEIKELFVLPQSDLSSIEKFTAQLQKISERTQTAK